jgi:phospholipase A2
MDSGMSNNLPNHILARPERGADVLLAFDTSSDVQTGSALRRIHNWADDCNIELEEQTAQFQSYPRRFPSAAQDVEMTPAQATEARFHDQYAKVFRGVREDGQELYLVYCPLLPSGVNPDFDPSVILCSPWLSGYKTDEMLQTASFSTSYNLVWTPGQIKKLCATTEANMSDYAIHTIRQVVRKVYDTKRERRLNDETRS